MKNLIVIINDPLIRSIIQLGFFLLLIMRFFTFLANFKPETVIRDLIPIGFLMFLFFRFEDVLSWIFKGLP